MNCVLVVYMETGVYWGKLEGNFVDKGVINLWNNEIASRFLGGKLLYFFMN